MIRKLVIVTFSFLFYCNAPAAETRKEPFDGKWSVAIFAGGCFWCMEPPFEKLNGVKEVISGYTGGSQKNPTYDEVSYGKTDHVEAVLIRFDSKQITYRELLDVYWKTFNPMQDNGQFYDIGTQYRSGIFYLNEEQRDLAQQSKEDLEQSGRFPRPIVTEIMKAKDFWRAEEYHQDYYKKNPAHYNRYRIGSGRDAFIKKYWGK